MSRAALGVASVVAVAVVFAVGGYLLVAAGLVP